MFQDEMTLTAIENYHLYLVQWKEWHDLEVELTLLHTCGLSYSLSTSAHPLQKLVLRPPSWLRVNKCALVLRPTPFPDWDTSCKEIIQVNPSMVDICYHHMHKRWMLWSQEISGDKNWIGFLTLLGFSLFETRFIF